MISISPVQFSEEAFLKYVSLFSVCFPNANKYSYSYLKWLYCSNPDGVAVGFDAWDGDILAAHYVCIPTVVSLGGVTVNALLSLNTATHPTYQGQGLFTKLADKTYQAGMEKGFECVYGIANANSTPGFVRKLGFQLIEPLEAQIGLGPLNIDFDSSKRAGQFERIWSQACFEWRCRSPANVIHVRKSEGVIQLHATGISTLLPVYAEQLSQKWNETGISAGKIIPPFRIFIGLIPEGAVRFRSYVDIPSRLRPSPLNFIYRSLSDRLPTLEKGQISLSFLDFDAY